MKEKESCEACEKRLQAESAMQALSIKLEDALPGSRGEVDEILEYKIKRGEKVLLRHIIKSRDGGSWVDKYINYNLKV